MKEILAIIRMNKIQATKEALVNAGFPGFNAVKVAGRGQQALDAEVIQALNNHPEDTNEVLPLLAHCPRLIPKRLVSLVVPDEQVSRAVDTLIQANQTGNSGDGKIFVLPVFDSVRVRTGEVGRVAVDEMTG
ncbi:P-II family nitrogen regulator [Geitlerinema sp. PCC 9228]|jgi:nitrogen regulatory protein PII 2|uniref:P-II family nitrogen regulator n=1 Tax=Geitlerinema sp. PCC 9228 TaxID=111611 RepID=UPI0008F9D845|nr:P-II family nitrogen regulator [Geitlerinema sp. PCC 9228]